MPTRNGRSRRFGAWRESPARRLAVAFTVVGLFLAGCSNPTSAVSSNPPQVSSGHIVFLSDQGVVLPRSGTTYHFIAHVVNSANKVVDEPLEWRSTAPRQVAVSPMGIVTAQVATGSATIVVSASGVPSQAAQVTVAQPAPGTLLVPSTDVLAVSPTAATLKLTTQTRAIRVGQLLVSDNRGGLLSKVSAVTITPGSVQLATTSASLAQAFDRLSVHATGAPVTTPVSTKHLSSATTAGMTRPSTPAELTAAVADHRGGVDPAAGASTQAVLAADTSPGSTVECTLSSGVGVTVSLAGPNVSVPATVQLIGVLQTSFLTVDQFEVAVQATVPVVVSTGSVTVSAAGTTDATCDLNIPPTDIPTPIFIGPIEINGTVDPAAGVDLSVDAGGEMTFAGPTVSDTASALDGINYTSSGGWQAVEENSQSGVQVTPGGSSFNASLTASASPDLRVDFGISAVLGDCAIDLCTTLAGVNLAFAEAKGDFTFQIASPFNELTAGYGGPTWGAGVDFTAGPEFAVSGDIVDLFDWIGVDPPAAQWNAFDDNVPLAGSPKVTVTTITTTSGSVQLTASLSAGFSGDTVKFVAYPTSGGTGTTVATAPVTGTLATATWTPSASAVGSTYDVSALLFDNVFGPVGLPYASATVSLTVGVGSSSTTTSTTSTTSTTTTSSTPTTSTEPAGTSTSSVSPNQQWNDTGIPLTAGEQVQIAATGQVEYDVNQVSAGDWSSTPAGYPLGSVLPTGETCPPTHSVFDGDETLASAPCGSLVARVGGGAPFEVGTSDSFTAPASGDLMLGDNVWYWGSESGGFTATITTEG